MALDHKKERGSDLVEGIAGGFETPLPVPRVVRQKKVNTFIHKARSLFDNLYTEETDNETLTQNVLAPETQMPVLIIDEQGRVVDKEGNFVDLTRFGIELDTVAIPETQLNSTIADDDDADAIDADVEIVASDQAISTPLVTQATQLSTQMSCIPERSQLVPQSDAANAWAPNADGPSTSTGKTMSQKRKLMSKDTASDFLEDHMIELLDAGKMFQHKFHTSLQLEIILFFV